MKKEGPQAPPLHVVSLSGGKDSTAMLLMMLERDMPVDKVIFADTGKEFPQLYENLDKLERRTGITITRLVREQTFDYYMFEHAKTKGKNVGEKGYGWPTLWARWCTAAYKQDLIDKYVNSLKKENQIVLQYIGIAADEPTRIKEKCYPLAEWGVTEREALEYCYSHGFDWGGLYEHFDRVSCWCCPLKNLKELRALRTFYPELWQELRQMDKRARNSFRPRESVEDLERRFALEDQQTKLY